MISPGQSVVSRPLGALELAVVRVGHAVVAGADVAGVLAGAGRHAVAALAADVALVVAHLVPPVVGAPTQNTPWDSL